MTFSSPQQYEEQYAQGYGALKLLSPKIIFEPVFKKGFKKYHLMSWLKASQEKKKFLGASTSILSYHYNSKLECSLKMNCFLFWRRKIIISVLIQ